MAEKTPEPKRLNRTIPLGDAMGPILGPALRRRGFAGRDIITHWAAIAPKPYDAVARPDKLTWPRGGERTAEGAVLYLRCLPGHALAVQHEGQKIAAAVNRYFGYFLVREVRLSIEAMTADAETGDDPTPVPSRAVVAAVEGAVEDVADEGVKEALRRLGQGIMGRARP